MGETKQAWPADKIERRKVDDFVPYARNARTHSNEQVMQIAASIKEWGWTNPILVDEEGGIIAGHGRVLAALKLGIEDVPAMVATGWTDAQKRAYILADNQLALNAGWDMEMLQVELRELDDLEFDVDLIGFDGDFLANIINDPTEGLTDPDEIPEVPDDPITQEGNVWVLGNHRIICGDATNPLAWEAMDVPDGCVVFSSPPYNMGDASGLRDKQQKGVPKSKKLYDKYDDAKSSDDYTSLLSVTANIGFEYCDAVVFNLQPLADSKRSLVKWMDAYATHLVDVITWDKGRAAPHIQKGIMASQFEWIIILSKSANASRVIPFASWQGKFGNVYRAPPQTKTEYTTVHKATFPVHLPQFVIGDLMNRSRGVVDCFLGTGTTIIAAEMLGKHGRGMELSPAYVDVAVKRWQDFTGQDAILEGDGSTYKELSNGREPKAA